MIADLITPEVRDLMDRIERLAEQRSSQPPGVGYTLLDQELGAATYWGAPLLVTALRSIEAACAAGAETHDLMCSGTLTHVSDDQLALDLAA